MAWYIGLTQRDLGSTVDSIHVQCTAFIIAAHWTVALQRGFIAFRGAGFQKAVTEYAWRVMVLCIIFPCSIPQRKDLLLMYHMDCFPERSALFSLQTLFQRHFFLSPIMFMEQDVAHTVSSLWRAQFRYREYSICIVEKSKQSEICDLEKLLRSSTLSLVSK